MKREVALSVVAVVLLATVQWALADTRHSGTIVAVDPAHRTMTLQVMGPWSPGHTAVKNLTVEVGDNASVDRVERVGGNRVGNAGWLGGYREQATTLLDLKPGDSATVTGNEQNGRFVAQHVTVVVPDQDVMASPRTESPQPVGK